MDAKARTEIISRYDNKCGNCGALGTQVHHIVPKSIGGTDSFGNLVLLCDECHGLIHDSTMIKNRTMIKNTFKKYKENNIKTKSGRWWGKQPVELPANSNAIYEMYNNKMISREQAIKKLGIGTTSFYKYNPYKK